MVLLGLNPRISLAPSKKVLLVLTARLAPVAVAPSEQPPTPLPASAVLPKTMPAPPPPKPVPAPSPLELAPPPHPALSKPAIKPQPTPRKPAPVEAIKAAPAEPVADAPATAAPSAQPAAPAQARSAVPGPAGVTGETPARSGNEADNGTLDKYRMALIVATRRYKRYPAIAMEKGWQGKVEVHMVIGANGMLASASIKTSSGYEILDNQAIDMLRKGKTTVQVPESLRGREFSVDVPVIFNLDNPNS
jgi:periplasmic protein TonB